MSPFSHGYELMTVIFLMLLWGTQSDVPAISKTEEHKKNLDNRENDGNVMLEEHLSHAGSSFSIPTQIILPLLLLQPPKREISSPSDFSVQNFLHQNFPPLQSVGVNNDQHRPDLSLSVGYRTLMLCLLATFDHTNVKLTHRYRIIRKCITSRKQSISSNYRVKSSEMESSRTFNKTFKASVLAAQNISKIFSARKHHNLSLTAKAHRRQIQRDFSEVVKFKRFSSPGPSLRHNKHIFVYESGSEISDTSQSTTTTSILNINSRRRRSLDSSVQKVKLKGKVPAVSAEPGATSHAGLVRVKGSGVQYLGLDRNSFNMTELKEILKKEAQIRHLSRGAEIAYMCLVGLLVTMLWAIWYLGGFTRCHYQPQNRVFFSEEDNYLSVREVLERKKEYLPMLQGQPEWQDVLLCSRGGRP